MIRNLESLSTPTPDHADVCIVGAGGAGILLAVTLANAGRKVMLLEGGGLHLEHDSQRLYDSEVIGRPHQGIHSGRFRTYGGTTTEWGGQILELDDTDFTSRPHVPCSGWPILKSELRPYYDQAAQAEGLSRSLPGDAIGRKTLLERLRIPIFPSDQTSSSPSPGGAPSATSLSSTRRPWKSPPTSPSKQDNDPQRKQ